jgi:hypothetical protein
VLVGHGDSRKGVDGKKEEVKPGEWEVCSGHRGGCMQWWAFVCCLTWKWSDHRPLHPLANWVCTCTKYPIAEPALKRVPGSQFLPCSSCRSALMLGSNNNRSGHDYLLPFHYSWLSGRRMQLGFRGHASNRSVANIRASHSTHCISGSHWTPPERKSWRAVTHLEVPSPSFPTRHTLAERTEA